MKKLLGGLTLACMVAVLLYAAVARAQEGPLPLCVIEEMRHDMGEVFEQDKYAHVFKVRNSGEAELQILSVKPG
jgi:hypothetical protein